MKKMILMIALVFGAAAYGQETEKKMVLQSSEKASTEVTADNTVSNLVEALGLRADQQKKLEELLAKRKETVSQEKSLSKEYKIEDDKILEEEFRAVLTPEQNQKLDELQKEYKNKSKEQELRK